MVFCKSRNLGIDLELKILVFENFSFFRFLFGLWVFVFGHFEFGFWFLGISSLGFDFWGISSLDFGFWYFEFGL